MSEQPHHAPEEIQQGMTLDDVHAQMSERLVPFLRGKGFSSHDAEDAAQEAFMRLVQRWPTLREVSSNEIYAWLYATARNAGISALRKRKQWTLLDDKLEDTHLEKTESKNEIVTTEEIEQGQQQYRLATEYILRAFDCLPHEKTTLLLGVMQGKKQNVLAREIGVHESGVSRKLATIYQEMRTGLLGEGITHEVLQFHSM